MLQARNLFILIRININRHLQIRCKGTKKITHVQIYVRFFLGVKELRSEGVRSLVVCRWSLEGRLAHHHEQDRERDEAVEGIENISAIGTAATIDVSIADG